MSGPDRPLESDAGAEVGFVLHRPKNYIINHKNQKPCHKLTFRNGICYPGNLIIALNGAHLASAEGLRGLLLRNFMELLQPLSVDTVGNGISSMLPVAPPTIRPIRSTWQEMAAQAGETKWLWQGYAPSGYSTCLAGRPKGGKSFIAMYIAGVATGALKSWPDGEPGPATPGYVVWCESEGRLGVNFARAGSMGIPLDRIVPPLPPPNEKRPFRLDDVTHMAALRETVAAYQPRLIVLDALAPSHGLEENSAKVGSLLAELNSIAQDTGCAVLILHHVRKKGANAPIAEISMDDLRGSSAIPAAVVSILGIDEPDRGSNVRRLVHVASNVGPEKPAIGFQIMDTGNGRATINYVDPPEVRQSTGTMAQCREDLLEILRAEGTWMEASAAKAELLRMGYRDSTISKVSSQLRESGLVELDRTTREGSTVPTVRWRAKDAGDGVHPVDSVHVVASA